MDAIGSISSLASIGSGGGSIGGVGQTSLGSIEGGTDAQDAAGGSGGSFVDALGDALGQLNSQLSGADAAMASFASGGTADLHTVMLQMQEASLGLSLGVQVRDKLLDAYQQIMHLQV